jgi:hypothetical protein
VSEREREPKHQQDTDEDSDVPVKPLTRSRSSHRHNKKDRRTDMKRKLSIGTSPPQTQEDDTDRQQEEMEIEKEQNCTDMTQNPTGRTLPVTSTTEDHPAAATKRTHSEKEDKGAKDGKRQGATHAGHSRCKPANVRPLGTQRTAAAKPRKEAFLECPPIPFPTSPMPHKQLGSAVSSAGGVSDFEGSKNEKAATITLSRVKQVRTEYKELTSRRRVLVLELISTIESTGQDKISWGTGCSGHPDNGQAWLERKIAQDGGFLMERVCHEINLRVDQCLATLDKAAQLDFLLRVNEVASILQATVLEP